MADARSGLWLETALLAYAQRVLEWNDPHKAIVLDERVRKIVLEMERDHAPSGTPEKKGPNGHS